MRLPDIVARAEQAGSLTELRRAVVELALALVQLEAERNADARKDRTQTALIKGLERVSR